MRHACPRAFLLILIASLIGSAPSVRAQSVDLGGTAFLDYFYTLSSAEPDGEGLHGFTARRLYLTADFDLSQNFYGRARLEADDGSVGPNGLEPFVKDLWLTWNYAGDHEVTLGITPPPAVQISEDEFWGYRSLDQILLKFQDVVPSRDFGVRFDGPIGSSGTVSYAVMLANNNARSPESDPYKRIYGQLRFFPTEHLAFTLGADYAGYGDTRESGTQVNAFAGYRVESYRLGAEAYRQVVSYDFPDAEFVSLGLSLFGIYRIASDLEVIARVDRVHNGELDQSWSEIFVTGGLSYSPIEEIRIIPNLWLHDDEAAGDVETLARVTVELDF